MMTAANYLPAENAAEADAAVAILGTDSEWISVYSDFFEFGEPKQFQDIARPISERLHTDVLGIACFDSDFMFMNLINPEQKLDAFARIGGGYGVKRRSNFNAWKNKVTGLDAFKRCAAENEYAFAEEFPGRPCILPFRILVWTDHEDDVEHFPFIPMRRKYNFYFPFTFFITFLHP